MNAISDNARDDRNFMGSNWGWVLGMGVIFALLGVVALSYPVVSTLSLTYWIASVLLIGGIVRALHAIKLRHEKGEILRIFHAALSIIVSAMIFRYPGAGMLGLALALGFYFFFGATLQWVVAWQMKPAKGWGWGIANSVASFLLGLFLVFTFPFSALWLPGTLLGIEFIIGGASLVGISMAVQKARSTPPLHTSGAV